MPPTRRDTIRAKALELIQTTPKGLRYSELVARIHESFPDIPKNTITGSVWNLDAIFPAKVFKPARGVFQARAFGEPAVSELEAEAGTAASPEEIVLQEEQFYEPFADWRTKELEECTKAIALGGNRFKDKWGTPDVIGIREPKKSDLIKPPTEIISAELKLDKQGLIIAFGQACAYKLFSHKSSIVVPSESSEEDIGRLDVLCRTIGLGLILFNADDPADPRFQIRVRAARSEPDMFYVNRYMKLLEAELFS